MLLGVKYNLGIGIGGIEVCGLTLRVCEKNGIVVRNIRRGNAVVCAIERNPGFAAHELVEFPASRFGSRDIEIVAEGSVHLRAFDGFRLFGVGP